jgi:SidE phosphodiesterase (PDE) domain
MTAIPPGSAIPPGALVGEVEKSTTKGGVACLKVTVTLNGEEYTITRTSRGRLFDDTDKASFRESALATAAASAKVFEALEKHDPTILSLSTSGKNVIIKFGTLGNEQSLKDYKSNLKSELKDLPVTDTIKRPPLEKSIAAIKAYLAFIETLPVHPAAAPDIRIELTDGTPHAHPHPPAHDIEIVGGPLDEGVFGDEGQVEVEVPLGDEHTPRSSATVLGKPSDESVLTHELPLSPDTPAPVLTPVPVLTPAPVPAPAPVLTPAPKPLQTITTTTTTTKLTLNGRVPEAKLKQSHTPGVLEELDSIRFYNKTNNTTFENTPLPIEIGDCGNSKKTREPLTDKNLSEVFRIANDHTINKEYLLEPDKRKIDGELIERPNHNGTHCARQVRYLEALLDLIKNKGTDDAKGHLKGLNEENLKLAVYLLRAGRQGEGRTPATKDNNHKIRSAQVYKEYAKQFAIPEEDVIMTMLVIKHATEPDTYVPKELMDDPKFKFLYDLVSTAHQLDLPRCYDAATMSDENKHIDAQLGRLLGTKNANNCKQQLRTFAKKVTEATGETVYDSQGKKSPRKDKFATYSNDAVACRKKLIKQTIPTWN